MDWIERHFPAGLLGLVGSLTVLFFVFAGWAMYEENKRWETFRIAHQCKVVAHVSGSTTVATGFSSSGNVTITPIIIPSKTGWLCDDGVTYYR